MSGQPPGGLGLLDRLLTYVDRPWKIGAIVILALTTVVSLTLYEKRGELAEAVLGHWVTPRLERGRFPKLARLLLEETGADVVTLSEISLHANLIKNIDGVKRDEPGWQPVKNPRPVFTAVRDPLMMLDLIEGKVICRDIELQDGTEEQELGRLGFKRRCFVGVPPVLDALVGGLQIAWRGPIRPEAESGASRLLYQAASQLATW